MNHARIRHDSKTATERQSLTVKQEDQVNKCELDLAAILRERATEIEDTDFKSAEIMRRSADALDTYKRVMDYLKSMVPPRFNR